MFKINKNSGGVNKYNNDGNLYDLYIIRIC
jgi:hypothetical protein